MVSEEGSLSKAAHRLNMTQSGLSRAITEIEEVAEGHLFVRTGKGTVCTPLGSALCRHARVILGEFSKAATELASIASGEEGTITIGCFSMFSGWPLAEAVRSFRAQYPRVSLVIRTGTHEALMEELAAARLDVLVSRQPPPQQRDAYRWIPLLTDTVVLACAHGHPLAEAQAVSLADCAAFPWLTAPPGAQTRMSLEASLTRQGCRLPDIIGALSLGFALEMLTDRWHLCMLPGSVATVLQRRGVLRVLHVNLALHSSPLAVIWRRERSSTRPVRCFATALSGVIQNEQALAGS